jgi:hypothetical protein
MTTPTLRAWLNQHLGTDDRIGDLARDIHADPELPPDEPLTREHLEQHLAAGGACPAANGHRPRRMERLHRRPRQHRQRRRRMTTTNRTRPARGSQADAFVILKRLIRADAARACARAVRGSSGPCDTRETAGVGAGQRGCEDASSDRGSNDHAL